PALAVDALEVPDQMHAEVPARRQRSRAHHRSVIRLAQTFDEASETVIEQNFLQTIVEHMPRRLRQLVPAQQHLALPVPLPPHRHGCSAPSSLYLEGITPSQLRQQPARLPYELGGVRVGGVAMRVR